ncbi:uncharacterized protein [Nothobranchius furzeri]|uniref:uncharacterized protein n=1 Tax=Nothobranchius furzeri TaxID=105023 RepID=UPI0039049E99
MLFPQQRRRNHSSSQTDRVRAKHSSCISRSVHFASVSSGGRFRREASCRLFQINRASVYKELSDHFTSPDDDSLWELPPLINTAITRISPPSLISPSNWTDPLSHRSPPSDIGLSPTQLTPVLTTLPKFFDLSPTTQPRSCTRHHRHVWRCTFSFPFYLPSSPSVILHVLGQETPHEHVSRSAKSLSYKNKRCLRHRQTPFVITAKKNYSVVRYSRNFCLFSDWLFLSCLVPPLKCLSACELPDSLCAELNRGRVWKAMTS